MFPRRDGFAWPILFLAFNIRTEQNEHVYHPLFAGPFERNVLKVLDIGTRSLETSLEAASR